MAELPHLTLAFLQGHPVSAARTLETLAPEDAAALLEHVPVRIAAPVAGAMSSVAAARCIARLPDENRAGLCAALSWADASAVLRQLGAPTRDAVLDRLPTSMARRFRRSLEYDENEVGAWIDLDAPAIVADRTVGDALRLLGQAPEFPASHVLLTDGAQRYLGVAPLSGLLRVSPATPLDSIAQRGVRALRDAATLASVVSNDDWQSSTVLPVVNHRGELLGGLTRTALHKALDRRAHKAPAPHSSLFVQLFETYLTAAAGLFQLLVQTSDPAPGGAAERGS
ncbi:MAG TPA: hypothetical protein VLD59_19455 [Steroidobacteraceae bacterium]|nr:hypothetical protein [Steroidobacteraceae bacterium]